MDIGEFEDLLDRLGEDVSRWPSPSREAAQALLRDSEKARAIAARAIALRDAFANTPRVRAPTGLADRIVARALEQSPPPQRITAPAESRNRAVPTRLAFVFSLCFVIGITVGLLPAPGERDTAGDFAALIVRLVD